MTLEERIKNLAGQRQQLLGELSELNQLLQSKNQLLLKLEGAMEILGGMYQEEQAPTTNKVVDIKSKKEEENNG